MANQKLSATVQIGSVIERSVKKNIGILKSGLEGVGNEIKSVADRQKELSKQRKVLDRQGRSVAELDREYAQLGRQLETLKRKQAAWNRAAAASKRVGQDFRRMTGEVTRVARTAAFAVGAAATAVFGLAASTAALGDDVAKSADKLGIGIEAFQELRYAAERSGVPIAAFDSSMVAFVKRLGEAKAGTGPTADAIKQLGLNVGDLLALKPEDALSRIADEMAKVENPAERAALASDLFSRSGIGMVNMLKDGSAGLEQLRADARATGYVLSEQTARDAEVFQDRLLDAQLTVKGLKNVIGGEFIPVVTRAMETFTQWAQSNKEDVASFAKATVESIERMIPVIGSLLQGLGEVSMVVGRIVSGVSDLVGGWENLGMIIGAVMASKAILSIGAFALSVGKLGWAMWALVPALPVVASGIGAIGLALAANPIGLAVAAIAGSAALIYTFWGPIKSFFVKMWDGVKVAFDAARVWVGETIDTLVNVSGISVAWQGVKDALGLVLDWIGARFEWVLEKIRPVVDALKWVQSKAAGGLDAIGLGGNPNAPGSDTNPYPAGHPLHRPQNRATGGIFKPGPLVTGEQGRELQFATRSGFIATNRQTERIASLAAAARENIARASGALSAGAGSGGAGSGPVTNHIQINAAGMSAQAILDELERRMRRAAGGSLFDGVRGYGQYGGLA